MTAANGESQRAADRIRAFERAVSAEELVAATRQLTDCDDPLATVPQLVQVLGFNNPGAAVAAVDGLIAIGPGAVGPLLAHLDAHNYGARAWAVRALAGIGDPRGLDVLEDALATDVGPSVRRPRPGAWEPCGWRAWPSRSGTRSVSAAWRPWNRVAATASGLCAMRWRWASRAWPCPCRRPIPTATGPWRASPSCVSRSRRRPWWCVCGPVWP